ncbi:MAG TPA: hydroxymethylbilane synthase, partial [Candidatus Limnocylindria bacterium]|nr:hydroxymethylbilane synthase [Candidatus Limnocylindria bacterium]
VAPAALLPFEVMLPAPAQAALAVQVRADDTALRDRLGAIDHQPSRVAVEAERALLAEIGGGCLAPLGALGEIDGERLRLRAAYEARNGRFERVDAEGPAEDWPATVARAASGLREAVA